MKRLIRFLSKWAWEKELSTLDKLEKERDVMLEDLEHCGWPCMLVELPHYYRKLSNEYTKVLAENMRLSRKLRRLGDQE